MEILLTLILITNLITTFQLYQNRKILKQKLTAMAELVMSLNTLKSRFNKLQKDVERLKK